MKREVVFEALVGSHNYNLATEGSDKDYKVFTFPTFEDLYHGKMESSSVIGKDVDRDYHDIRKIVDLFWKANLNFIEVLYAKEYIVYGNYYEIKDLFNMKYDLVRMNLPYLYNSCRGMYYNKLKYLEKGTEGTQHLVDMYGYDTKQALHADRILDFAMKFADNEFKDFSSAITYDFSGRNNMLAIKHGAHTLEEYKEMSATKFEMFSKYESKYMAMKPDEEAKHALEDLIMSLVKRHLTLR